MPDDGSAGFSTVDSIPAEFSDENLALRFTAEHRNSLRYVSGWGRWLEWDGSVWRNDDTLRVYDRARRICRAASSECDKDGVAAKVASGSTVAAVERLARADRAHAATVGQWDTDPWLLNTPGGVVDLRTGHVRPAMATDYMSKCTAVAPSTDPCPLWLQFLDRVTAGDRDLQSYLQRVAGYCLTGSTREHAMFFAFGTGANGKGVLINTLTALLGDYASVAAIETFTASQTERHPTDLAMLRGARMVTAQETEEGRRWAESKIKSLTGGDPISARFMRQDFFTFHPAFKLLIAGNHRPGLRNIDEAIRRRFNMLPFSVRIPPEERDKTLPERLKTEWPGILRWAIDGCLDWQDIGLAPPKAVTNATEEYLEAEDALGRWLTECCITHGSLHTAASALFASWREWADASGEQAGSQKRFSQALKGRDFQDRKLANTNAGFVGLGLKPPSSSQAGRYGYDE